MIERLSDPTIEDVVDKVNELVDWVNGHGARALLAAADWQRRVDLLIALVNDGPHEVGDEDTITMAKMADEHLVMRVTGTRVWRITNTGRSWLARQR